MYARRLRLDLASPPYPHSPHCGYFAEAARHDLGGCSGSEFGLGGGAMAVCGADDSDREARWWRGRAAVRPADDGRRVGRGSRRRCVAPRVGLAVAVTAERGERGGVDDSGRRIAATCRGRDECGGGWREVPCSGAFVPPLASPRLFDRRATRHTHWRARPLAARRVVGAVAGAADAGGAHRPTAARPRSRHFERARHWRPSAVQCNSRVPVARDGSAQHSGGRGFARRVSAAARRRARLGVPHGLD